jgi:hypothetical protein
VTVRQEKTALLLRNVRRLDPCQRAQQCSLWREGSDCSLLEGILALGFVARKAVVLHQPFSTHGAQRLEGHCPNFISKDKWVDFGQVQYIKPTKKHSQIRLRFTPGHGKIYGPKLDANELERIYGKNWQNVWLSLAKTLSDLAGRERRVFRAGVVRSSNGGPSGVRARRVIASRIESTRSTPPVEPEVFDP